MGCKLQIGKLASYLATAVRFFQKWQTVAGICVSAHAGHEERHCRWLFREPHGIQARTDAVVVIGRARERRSHPAAPLRALWAWSRVRPSDLVIPASTSLSRRPRNSFQTVECPAMSQPWPWARFECPAPPPTTACQSKRTSDS
jgi:hypothetical protein